MTKRRRGKKNELMINSWPASRLNTVRVSSGSKEQHAVRVVLTQFVAGKTDCADCARQTSRVLHTRLPLNNTACLEIGTRTMPAPARAREKGIALSVPTPSSALHKESLR